MNVLTTVYSSQQDRDPAAPDLLMMVHSMMRHIELVEKENRALLTQLAGHAASTPVRPIVDQPTPANLNYPIR